MVLGVAGVNGLSALSLVMKAPKNNGGLVPVLPHNTEVRTVQVRKNEDGFASQKFALVRDPSSFCSEKFLRAIYSQVQTDFLFKFTLK